MSNKLQLQVAQLEIDKTQSDLNVFEQKKITGGVSFEGLSVFNNGGSLNKTSEIIVAAGFKEFVINSAVVHLDGGKVVHDILFVVNGEEKRIVASN